MKDLSNTKIEKKIVFATNNKHKLSEVRALLEGQLELLSLEEVGIKDDIEETADTFLGNALIKARYVHQKTGLPTLADDSGLVVEALAGAPGVYSARYAGLRATSQDNIDKLLQALAGETDRRAAFVCVLALVGAEERSFEGRISGTITEEMAGVGGFGYDPIFVPEGYSITFAEMPAEEKNKISHRARALEKLKQFLCIES